jgi:hypothetical protein
MHAPRMPDFPFGETRSTGTLNEQDYVSTLAFAVENMRRANLSESDIQLDPSGLDLIGAAFRQGNSIIGAWASNTNAVRRAGNDGPVLSRAEVVERVRKDGLSSMLHLFGDVDTEAMYEATKADLAREQQDQRMLAAATGMQSTALLLAAGVLDFPTLLPAGSLLPFARGANLARTARNVAAAAGLDAAATEAVLQQSQVSRPWEETALNVSASVVLGGLLGAGVHKALGPAVARKVEDRMDDLIREGQAGFEATRRASQALVREMEQHIDDGTMGSHRLEIDPQTGAFRFRSTVGAAHLTADEQLVARGLDGSGRVFSAGAFESLDMLGKAPGLFGDNLRIPRLELEHGATRQERDFVEAFTFNPSVNKKHVPGEIATEGVAAPRSVSADIARFQGEFAQAIHETSDLYKKNKANYANLDDFAEKVTLALVNGDRSSDPIVQRAAEIFRKRVFDPIKEQHIANGNFMEGLEPRNATSYFPLVLDAQAIRNSKEEFIDIHTAAFHRELEEEYRLALVEKQRRASTKEDITVGAREEQKKTVKEVRAEHDENIRAARETRKQEVKQFDQDARDMREKIRAERDDAIEEARDTKNEMIAGSLEKGERKRISDSYRAEIAKIRLRAEKELKKLEVRLTRERKALNKKHDDLDAKVREERDKAIAEAEARAAQQREEAKAIGLTEGLSVLRFSTREAREAEAARLALNYYNAAVGNTRFILDHEIANGVRGYSKFRASPIWHQTAIDKGWAKHNVFDIADHYVRAAGTDAAIGKHFKKPGKKITKEDGSTEMEQIGDPSLTELKRQVKAEYDNLIASAGSPERELAFANKRDRALQNIDLLRDFARGFQPTEGNASLMRTAEVIGTLNYMRLMGGVVTASLGDPINIAIANGFGRTMKHGIVPMLTDFNAAYRNASGPLRKLSRLVMANAEIELNSRIVQMAELGNPHARVDAGTNFLRNMAKMFSQFSGITYWNSFWKQVAYNTAQARIVEHSLSGWSSLTKAERTWLNTLGINKDGLEKIANAYRGQSGEPTIAGVPVARFDEWADRDAAGLMQAALSNESHNMIVTPHFSDKMGLNANPATALLMQFRRFMIANQMRVIGRNIQLASVDDTMSKRIGVSSGLFGLAMMGALVDATKHTMGTTTITGANVDERRNAGQRVIDEWQKTPGTALYNALDRSSVFGIVFEGSNMLEKVGLPNIRGVASFVAQDDKSGRREASRFANRSVMESIGGPTFGAIEDAGKLAALSSGGLGYMFGIVEDPHFNRSDFRRARRFIPFQNIPVVQQILNEGERYGGTIFDWPVPN